MLDGFAFIIIVQSSCNVNNPQSVPCPAAQKPDIRDRLIGEYLSPSLASFAVSLGDWANYYASLPTFREAFLLSWQADIVCHEGSPSINNVHCLIHAQDPKTRIVGSLQPAFHGLFLQLRRRSLGMWPGNVCSGNQIGSKFFKSMVLGSRGVYPISSRSSSMLLCLNTEKWDAAWRTQKRNQK